MSQTVLKLALESTNEKLTPRTGVVILGEYLKGMKLEKLNSDNLPKSVELWNNLGLNSQSIKSVYDNFLIR